MHGYLWDDLKVLWFDHARGSWLSKLLLVLFFVLLWTGCAYKPPPPHILLPVAVPLPPPTPFAATESLRPLPDRADHLRMQIDQILNSPDVQDASWGVKVLSLDRSEVLYERNSGALLAPASNMKIVTAAAAL